MNKAVALLRARVAVGVVPAFAQKRGPAPVKPTVPLAEILDHVRADRDAVDFRATGRLVHVNAKQERRTFGVSIKAHTFAAGPHQGDVRGDQSGAVAAAAADRNRDASGEFGMAG